MIRTMRRTLLTFLGPVILLVLFSQASVGDDNAVNAETAPPASGGPIIILEPPTDWIGPEIKVTDLPLVPAGPTAGPAADQCAEATPLVLSFVSPANGGGTLTNGYTGEETDPTLICMFGAPTNPSGYRTAWYELVAGDTSEVTITTEGTDYDTVLGIYTGDCESLTSIACSDDFRGFQSSVSFRVVRGRSYFILVADYKPGVPAAALLQLSAVMRAGSQLWTQTTNSPVGGITRHALVSQGADMYVIGGQTNIQGVPVLSNRLMRYNVQTKQWLQLSDVPGASLSNTTAVRLRERFYIPGGFNGNTSDYANTHLEYTIPTDFWTTLAPIPTALLPEGRMFAWAAAAAAPDELSYYLTGGLASYNESIADPDGVVISNVYRYTRGSNSWSVVPAMSTARYAHTAGWVSRANRGLCVAGGLTTGVDNEGDPVVILLTNGECFNPNTGTWQPTGNMNFPRYNAGSAVGPDGNWYIFGGMDGRGAVPETEVYDPVTNQWRLLDGSYSLGGQPENPARVWPRGAFFGGSLFVFGGNDFPERRVISSVEQVTPGTVTFHAPNRILLPMTFSLGVENFLGFAQALPVGVTVSGNFTESTQFYNPYYFDWPGFGRAVIHLTNIPADSNFNIAVYSASKEILGEGNRALYGGEEIIPLTLVAGRYYVIVERIFPRDLPDRNDFYRLVVNRG